MGTPELKKGKFARLPIILFTVILPLLFILSLGTVFAAPPEANDDNYDTDEDTPLVVPSPGVLTNDHDYIDGQAVLNAAPLTGTVELLSSGAFTYTPPLNLNGVVTFSYYLSKTGYISTVGNVAITVAAVNDAPLAGDDNATTPEDTAVSIPVLANDSDLDGGLVTSTLTIISAPLSGTTGVDLATGAVTYTPTLNFNGNDSFVYQVSDDGIPTPTLSVTATVYLTVTAVNDPPAATNDSNTANEDTELSVNEASGVLNNDNDVDGDSLSVVGFDATSSEGAVINVNANGSYSYDPTNVAAFNALAVSESMTDTFAYTVSDGSLTDTATVNITVEGRNDWPTAVDDFASTTEDVVLAVPDPGVLDGDTDPDFSDVITAVSEIKTSNLGASVTINDDGTFTYNPQNVTMLQALNDGDSLQDTFSYGIFDGHGGTDNGTVTVTINGLNDAPDIDISGVMTLTNILEDVASDDNHGTLITDTITSAGGDRITDVDSEAVEGIAVVGVTNLNGVWQYSLDGSSWTAFGAVSDYNAVLLDTTEFIRFAPNADYTGSSGAISFRAWDQTSGFSGQANVIVATNGLTTPYSSAVETATLTVLNVNDAPVLDTSGALHLTTIGEDMTTNGDTVAAIIASVGGDHITDVDPGAQEGIAVIGVDNAHGTWQYSIDGGLNWFNFSVSLSNATLLSSQSRIRFVPQLDYFGSAGDITFRAWDLTSGNVGDTGVNPSPGGGTTAFSTAIETATLTIYPINDAPFLDLNGGGGGSTSSSATFTEDGGGVIIVESDLSITDVDDTSLTSARAVLTNPLDGTAESLSVTEGMGITAVYNPTTGILSLSGTTTKSNYETVLQTLAYNNSSQDPKTTSRLVEVTVNDGTDNSNVALSVVSVTPVNDAPILVNNNILPVNEGLTITISLDELLVTDVDNTAAEIVYTVISPPAHGDLLLLGQPLPLATNDTFTQADIDGNKLDYSNDGSEFSTDSFTFTVADGSGGAIGVRTFNISVNAHNDLPVLAINAGLSLDEGATSTITSSRLKVTDVDNTADQITYRLETAPVNGELLLNGFPLLTNGTFTQTQINDAKLAYVHDSSETISDSFVFSVKDGSGGMIDNTTFTITIKPVNDPPVVDLNGVPSGLDFATTFTEDGGAVDIVDNTLTVIDVDNTNLSSATAALVNRPNGTVESLSVNTGGTSVLASYSPATGVLTLSGEDTVDNYQAVLRSLKYNNTSQDPTETDRIVNVTVNDGSADSNVATSTITIQGINDPPTLSKNAGLTIDYGATGIINGSLLKITDLDNSASELVYTVKSLPANGQLKLNGSPLAINSTFTQANVDSGLLAYTHNKTNTESDSFQFTAVDIDGGSISQKTFAIVIHPQPIVYLPVALNNYVYSEPNDSACQAFAISLNISYQFLPDDREDWYKFTLATTANVVVQISDYVPSDGQMLVYRGSSCSAINQIGHDPSISPSGSLNFSGLTAGTYYVRIYTNDPPAAPPPYTLQVTSP